MSEPQNPQDPYGRPPQFQGGGEQSGWQQPSASQPQGGWGQPPASHPSGTSSEERNWAVAAHVGSFVAAYIALGFLAPLIVLLVKGKESAYIRAHAVESLNFQLSALIYIIVSAVLVLVFVGILMLAAVAIFYLIVVILATMRASNGEMYRYPLTIRMVT